MFLPTTLLLALAHLGTAVPAGCDHGHHGPPSPPPSRPLPRCRPPPSARTFASAAVDARLSELVNRTWKDPELATLLWNCLPNTLDTTVWQAPSGAESRTFVSTGDIAAMWLRDSQNQLLPYTRFARDEPDGIGRLISGLIRRHVDSVLLDPYANSFSFSPIDVVCHLDNWINDNSTRLDESGHRVDGMSVGVFQRKWEMDSLPSTLKLGRTYYNATGDAWPFGERWHDALRTIVRTYREMQKPLTPANFTRVNYTFQTLTHEPKDTSAHGIGRAHRWTGMVRTSFLPSDNSPRLPYHIPSNAFAVVELRGAAAMLRVLPIADEVPPPNPINPRPPCRSGSLCEYNKGSPHTGAPHCQQHPWGKRAVVAHRWSWRRRDPAQNVVYAMG